MAGQGSCRTKIYDRLHRARERLHRALAYFAVLRPSFIFGAVMVYLPLTAVHPSVPGSSMLANLFVEYGFWKGFWFGFALFGSVWALMLTACLSLDLARDRQRSLNGEKLRELQDSFGSHWLKIKTELVDTRDNWLPDRPDRRVTIPIRSYRTFILFTLMAALTVIIVVWRAADPLYAFAGLLLGGAVAFVSMDLVAGLLYSTANPRPVLPWTPILRGRFWRAETVRRRFSQLMKFAPKEVFDTETGYLKDDHFFAALSTAAVVCIYTIIYWLFKPSGIGYSLENIPPAAFIYTLLLPMIWIVTALWVYLSRYRLVFLAVVIATLLLTRLATMHRIESAIGGPTHTYDVVPEQNRLAANPPGTKLIVVAASGGGILAAGWTAHVLTQLHQTYPAFAQELRLISSVSGGSVGAAHYLNAFEEISQLESVTQRNQALEAVANDAMRSSLASTAYGVAFADFRRIVFPFFADQEFDRARLIEADWRRIANCRRAAIAQNIDDSVFAEFCRKQDAALTKKNRWISQLRTDLAVKPQLPTLIFNSTVMETGERIAITPIASLHSQWHGSNENPPRHAYARTLTQFLSATKTNAAIDPSKQDSGAQKSGSCDPEQFRNGYDIDLWSAARLSATFSYVSPAARAACFDPRNVERQAANDDSLGRLHLIDGGYHDNYGVASALDWIAAQQDREGNLPFERIALIEIRAKPDIPGANARTEWSSAWLGPFWGLFNSWGFAQSSANDTAVNQLIARLRQRKICIDSFIFVPKWSGPLSWHLSDEQKILLRRQWQEGSNPTTLESLKKFLNDDQTSKSRCIIG